jgi:hypothetical protein
MKKTLIVLAALTFASAANAQVSIGGSGSTSGGAAVQTPSTSGSVGTSGLTGLNGNVGKSGADVGVKGSTGSAAGVKSGGTSGSTNLGATVDENAKLKTR